MPFSCPECEAIIPVASLDGKHTGVDREAKTQTCWNCGYKGDTEDFDCEWEFTPERKQ